MQKRPAPSGPDCPIAAAARDSPAVPPRHRVPTHLARRFQQVCLGLASEVTLRAGLTPIEFGVLAGLDDAPDLDQRSLAAHLGIDAVTTHHILRRLEAAGHVVRHVHPTDRRARELRLTEQGHALRTMLRPETLAVQDRILAPLAPAERAAFVDMLTRLVQAHDSYARPGNGRRRQPAAASPRAPLPSEEQADGRD
jgi:DNA-binding MarR family transcriptional regulator